MSQPPQGHGSIPYMCVPWDARTHLVCAQESISPCPPRLCAHQHLTKLLLVGINSLQNPQIHTKSMMIPPVGRVAEVLSWYGPIVRKTLQHLMARKADFPWFQRLLFAGIPQGTTLMWAQGSEQCFPEGNESCEPPHAPC